MQRLPSNDSAHRVLLLSSAVSPDPAGGADKPVLEPQQTADFTPEPGRLTVAGGPAPAGKIVGRRRDVVRECAWSCRSDAPGFRRALS